ARLPTQPHRSLYVNERQGDELRKAGRSALLLARVDQMARPVPRALDVTEHHRHVRAQTDAMRCVVHVEPLRGRDLVRADHAAYLVVENLRGGPGQRAEAGLAQLDEILLERQA